MIQQPKPALFTCFNMASLFGNLVFVFGFIYAVVTAAGLLTLESAQQPIGNPYFTIMEILSIMLSALMLICMVAVYHYAEPQNRPFALASVGFMVATTVITSCVHFAVLTLGYTEEARSLPGYKFVFDFRWPSVVYALDILAWDWFFALSMLFAAPVFKTHQKVWLLILVCGLLSLAGLAGVVLGNMQVRNMGIIGYAVLAPPAFALMGKTMAQTNGGQQV